MGDYLNEAQQQLCIEIIHVGSGAVVSIIEVLSPSNQIGTGGEEYLRQQQQILASGTHLIEIDLRRTAHHTVACPTEKLPIPYQYLVCIHRAAPGWAVYWIPLQRRLPRIGMPLRKPDSDLVLDLQEILPRCYDNGGYEDFIDDRCAPTPPLEFSDAEWAELWLSENGQR